MAITVVYCRRSPCGSFISSARQASSRAHRRLHVQAFGDRQIALVGAFQRRRLAGAALVHEDQIAPLLQPRQARRQHRQQLNRRLTGAAGQEDHRVGQLVRASAGTTATRSSICLPCGCAGSSGRLSWPHSSSVGWPGRRQGVSASGARRRRLAPAPLPAAARPPGGGSEQGHGRCVSEAEPGAHYLEGRGPGRRSVHGIAGLTGEWREGGARMAGRMAGADGGRIVGEWRESPSWRTVRPSTEEPTMKLYYAPAACSLSPHIVLREAGLPFELVKVSTKTHKLADGSDFYAINSKGYVPVLEWDDGERLTEGPAIVQWLADQAPDQRPGAGGRHARARAAAGVAELHHQRDPQGLLAAVQPGRQRRHEGRRQAARWSAGWLGSKSSWRAATTCWASAVQRCRRLPVHCRQLGPVRRHRRCKQWPRLAAYLQRVAARPAVQAALQAEGLLKA